MTITITNELLTEIMSGNGGYSRKQLRLLGVEWPPRSGWKARIIGNKIEVRDKNELMPDVAPRLLFEDKPRPQSS